VIRFDVHQIFGIGKLESLGYRVALIVWWWIHLFVTVHRVS